MLYKSIIFFYLIFSFHTSKASDSIYVRPSTRYQMGFFHKIIFGIHYRDLWATPVMLEIFEIEKEAGGLKPVKLGGGLQTKSLRLVNKEGREFVLRSIYKDPSRALNISFLRNSGIGQVMIDQNSAENPYGALVIPELSEAAGIYYSKPKMVFVPYDEGFGEYAKDFANTIALFEERAEDGGPENLKENHASKIVGTKKMLEKVYENNHVMVDQRMFARCRIFDMLISDWGRHEDQWRWKLIETQNKNIYQPIPRDRDHAFYQYDDGILNWISRKFFQPKLQSFDNSYQNIRGLNLSAKFLDERFLNKLSKEDWIEIADSLKFSLTDSVIENAVRNFPFSVYNKVGERTIFKLKSRRDRMVEAAVEYYLILSENTTIAGTDKDEKILIDRINDQETSVTIFKMKKGETYDTLFNRIFFTSETRNLNIYGLGGEDVVEVRGKVQKGIRLNISGGKGNDEYTDLSRVRGVNKKTRIVDSREGTKLNTGRETKVKLKNHSYNYFDRKGFKDEKPKQDQ